MRFYASNVVISHFLARPTAFGWPSDPHLPSDSTSWFQSSKTPFPPNSSSHGRSTGRKTGTSFSTSPGITYFISGTVRQKEERSAWDHRLFCSFSHLRVIKKADSIETAVRLNDTLCVKVKKVSFFFLLSNRREVLWSWGKPYLPWAAQVSVGWMRGMNVSACVMSLCPDSRLSLLILREEDEAASASDWLVPGSHPASSVSVALPALLQSCDSRHSSTRSELLHSWLQRCEQEGPDCP